MITSSEWLEWVKLISVIDPMNDEIIENERSFVTSKIRFSQKYYRFDKKEFQRLKEKYPFFICIIDYCCQENPTWYAYTFENKGKIFTMSFEINEHSPELTVHLEHLKGESFEFVDVSEGIKIFDEEIFYFIRDAIDGLFKRHPERMELLFEKNRKVNDECLQAKLDEIKKARVL